MTAPNPQAVNSAMMTRLLSDSAGSTVRASLGGSASVIPVAWLQRAYPTTPFLAFSGGGITPSDTDDYTMRVGWWLIDDLWRGFYRLDALVPLIVAANPHDWLTNAFLKLAPSPDEKPDMPLRMNVRGLFFDVSMRQ